MAMLLNYSSNRKLTAKLFLEIKLGYIYMALDYIKSELFHSHFILQAPPQKKKPQQQKNTTTTTTKPTTTTTQKTKKETTTTNPSISLSIFF